MQSVIAGSTTSRFDQPCAVKSSRLPRRRYNAEGILRLRQEYRASHGKPSGCFFFPRIWGFLLATVPVYAHSPTQSCQNLRMCIPRPKSRCQFILHFTVICGIITGKIKGDICRRFFIAPPSAGLFFITREKIIWLQIGEMLLGMNMGN